MRKRHTLLVLLVLWALPLLSSDNYTEPDPATQKRSAFFVSYIKETFPNFQLTDGEYLFILSSGCFRCTFAVYNYLMAHPETVCGKYKAILISQSTVDKLSENILTIDTNVLCDTTNKLDRMSFGIFGVSVLKIQNQMIVATKSITVEEAQKDPASFFAPITFSSKTSQELPTQ
jgi:hypothetical protein